MFAPTVAFAQEDPYPTVPTTPTTVECTPGDNSVVCGTVVRVAGASSKSLAFTGGDSAVLAALGVAAIGSGGLILLFNRRRSTSPTT